MKSARSCRASGLIVWVRMRRTSYAVTCVLGEIVRAEGSSASRQIEKKHLPMVEWGWPMVWNYSSASENRLSLCDERFCCLEVIIRLTTMNMVRGFEIQTVFQFTGHCAIEIFFHVAVGHSRTVRQPLGNLSRVRKAKSSVAHTQFVRPSRKASSAPTRSERK